MFHTTNQIFIFSTHLSYFSCLGLPESLVHIMPGHTRCKHLLKLAPVRGVENLWMVDDVDDGYWILPWYFYQKKYINHPSTIEVVDSPMKNGWFMDDSWGF